MPFTLRILLPENASYELKNYYYDYVSHHDGDSGIDLIVPDDINIDSHYVGTIDHMIKCEMVDENNNFVSYYLYPRSSISKTPLMMANSVGIIDAGYRGNILSKVWIVDRNVDNYIINANTKLFQICSPTLDKIKVVVVDSLSNSSRGENGFGSTNR